MKARVARLKISLSQPEGHVDQADQCWHLYEWAHDTDERLPRVQAEDCDRYGNRQFKIVGSDLSRLDCLRYASLGTYHVGCREEFP
jgi:hypothetical protein